MMKYQSMINKFSFLIISPPNALFTQPENVVILNVYDDLAKWQNYCTVHSLNSIECEAKFQPSLGPQAQEYPHQENTTIRHITMP